MAVNLATKYADKIAQRFTTESYVKGKTGKGYSFEGVKSIKIYTPTTVPEGDYVRSGLNRYGTPVEMQDTVQELTMSQDKSFSLTIDKGNNMDQLNIKGAGQMLNLQIRERSVPAADKYALKRFATLAGNIVGVAAKPTKVNIIETIFDAAAKLDDSLVPTDGRYIYMTSEMCKFVQLSSEWVGNDKLGKKALEKGEFGEICGMTVVKVPTSYMPENCYLLITHRGSTLFPYKISDAKVHKDPVGLSGSLIEGRHYYDAFVIGAKADGVLAVVLSSTIQALTANTRTTNKIAITSTGATKIYYTKDGSDPRYSDSADVYTSAVTVAVGDVIKSYAVADGKYPSAVTETKIDSIA